MDAGPVTHLPGGRKALLLLETMPSNFSLLSSCKAMGRVEVDKAARDLTRVVTCLALEKVEVAGRPVAASTSLCTGNTLCSHLRND